ncbi:YppG family protein [Evansella sp. AB-P1]|uniref:YppG family protein n=1 Tax=Evansella sp. AB-P1 TaxID=3037653 RepID=UPI00241FE274|nr:YppG family protein [Evansella sp. AB-P1]MDG5786828.1 YppG family protein [Evansella sp. AB-P1]
MRYDAQSQQSRQTDPFTQMIFGPPRPQQNHQAEQYQPPHPYQQHYQNQYGQPFHQGNPYQQHGGQYPYPQQKMKGPKGSKVYSYFLKEDGSLDYEKIGNGVQQVSGIAGKVGPMVKQLSPLWSMLKK